MRTATSLIPLLFIAIFLSACEHSDDYEGSYAAEELEDQMEELEETFEDRREDLMEQLRDAEEAIRDELEEYEDGDRVSKEELEELRARMHESAQKIQRELRETDKDFEIAIQDLGAALEQIGRAFQDDSEVEPVDHRKLGDLLPREVSGMERYDTDGSSKSVMGIRTSKIEAKYEGSRNDMSIVLMDLGSISGVAALGMDFIDTKIDRETKNGFEKTTKIKGYPAFLEVDERGSSLSYGALIMVAERFMIVIEAEGEDLDRDIIEEVADRISFRRLERLARD